MEIAKVQSAIEAVERQIEAAAACFLSAHNSGDQALADYWREEKMQLRIKEELLRKEKLKLLDSECRDPKLQTSYGATAVQGTERPSMEDALCVAADPNHLQPSFFGVFDGHGGNEVAEMLKTSFWQEYKQQLLGTSDVIKATRTAYLKVDMLTLAQRKGFLGALKERGLGGTRCGATAATILLLPSKDGKKTLVAANVGDARVVMSSRGHAIQLTVDHKPDVESEKKRIEGMNLTTKKPLLVEDEGTWRIGGLLAVSRAFGDAYLKGWPDTRGGFGLIAEPDITIHTISPDDQVVILATDGLWDRLSNQEAIDFCLAEAEKGVAPQEITRKLAKTAQERGSSDDIAVVVVLLTNFYQSA